VKGCQYTAAEFILWKSPRKVDLMRRSADWMVLVDDRILEYMVEHDGTASAAELDKSELFHVGRSHLNARLNKLAEEGLLKKIGNGVFSITNEAEAYLEGEYNVGEAVCLNEDQADDGDPTAGEGVGEL
jgi:predicted transcriptional regulator of viral defense system